MERKGQRHWSKIDLEKLRHVRKDQLLIFFLVGVLLLVIALPSGTKEKEKDSRHREIDGEEAVGTQAEEQDYARYLERRLEETLSQLDGAGNVRVMVTLQSSAQKIVEKDTQGEKDAITEEDSQGGRRTSENTSHQETTVYEGMGEKKSGTLCKQRAYAAGRRSGSSGRRRRKCFGQKEYNRSNPSIIWHRHA